MNLTKMAQTAKKASQCMALAPTEQKNTMLLHLKELLNLHQHDIHKANEKDLHDAALKGLDEAMLERLSLKNRLEGMINDLSTIIALPDPIGQVLEQRESAHHLHIKKVTVPIGVLGFIYESRPNVTLDVSALSIKSGNASILRGGSESLQTNTILVQLIQNALTASDLPKEAIQLIQLTERAQVKELLQLNGWIDLIIPRGGASLHQFCRENSTIPVITGGIGICHLFVDQSARQEASVEVILNAKTQRPTVCNALDTLLVHQAIAEEFLPKVFSKLGEKGVHFRLDPISQAIAQSQHLNDYQNALPTDWDTEWLSLILGIKVVKNLEEAIQHIQKHSSGHSDGILSEDQTHIASFIKAIDSAAVYVNASTRFTDGGQLGLGAEVAISTQKFHARGPMGLQELTSYKWILEGNYTVRSN